MRRAGKFVPRWLLPPSSEAIQPLLTEQRRRRRWRRRCSSSVAVRAATAPAAERSRPDARCAPGMPGASPRQGGVRLETRVGTAPALVLAARLAHARTEQLGVVPDKHDPAPRPSRGRLDTVNLPALVRD